MELPGGLGTLAVGSMQAPPVETRHGTVRVETFGYDLRLGEVGSNGEGQFVSRWVFPRAVTVTRSNGQVERAPVRDGVRRVDTLLVLIGAFFALGSLALRRR